MEGLIATVAAGLAVYGALCFIWYIIMVIANWKIFSKAGEAGWKSLIPILNYYIEFKISWKGSMFWIYADPGIRKLKVHRTGGERGWF